MYSQCPECLTVYKIGAEVLVHGHGSARCGHCAATFDIFHTLVETLPAEPFQHLAGNVAGDGLPQLSVPALRPQGAQESILFDPDARMRRPQQARGAPTFARPNVPVMQRTRQWPWRLGVTLLLFSLIAQIGYAKRAPLLDDVRIRPLLDQVCSTLGCRLPLRHSANRLTLLSRDIRPHPSVTNALIISANLRNDADFAQAFPSVEITLSDLDENRIAMRRFRPSEYLSDTRTIAAGMAPGTTTALVFEVADPGKNAVAFEFRFE